MLVNIIFVTLLLFNGLEKMQGEFVSCLPGRFLHHYGMFLLHPYGYAIHPSVGSTKGGMNSVASPIERKIPAVEIAVLAYTLLNHIIKAGISSP